MCTHYFSTDNMMMWFCLKGNSHHGYKTKQKCRVRSMWICSREWDGTGESEITNMRGGSGLHVCECVFGSHGENRLVKWKYIAERWGGGATVSLFEKSIYFHTADPATHPCDGIVSLSVAFRASFLFILLSTEITQYKDELFLWPLYGNKCVTWMWCCCCVRSLSSCTLHSAQCAHLCCFHFSFIISSSSSNAATINSTERFLRVAKICGDVCARSNVTKQQEKKERRTQLNVFTIVLFWIAFVHVFRVRYVYASSCRQLWSDESK